MVHRDIKPANILLEEGVERVTITDFGLARAVDDASDDRSGVAVRAPQYTCLPSRLAASRSMLAAICFRGVLYAMCAWSIAVRCAGRLTKVLHPSPNDDPTPVCRNQLRCPELAPVTAHYRATRGQAS
ncbi:MAG: protein kinase [Planctomycetaceae bacterium]